MKLLERGDEHVNMGDLDTNQDRYVEDSGIGDINPGVEEEKDPHQQLGSLGFILGSLIAGTSNSESALNSVRSSNILGSKIKDLIMQVVDEERGRLERGKSQYNFSVGDESLQEIKKKIKTNFQRFL